jgi:hypothetical protein
MVMDEECSSLTKANKESWLRRDPGRGERQAVTLPQQRLRAIVLVVLHAPPGVVMVHDILQLRHDLLAHRQRPEPQARHPPQPLPLRLQALQAVHALTRHNVLDLPPDVRLVLLPLNVAGRPERRQEVERHPLVRVQLLHPLHHIRGRRVAVLLVKRNNGRTRRAHQMQ